MIDLHCHVLPGIDDGPPELRGALALADAAARGGTRTIVATPHVSWDWRDNDAASIAAGVDALQAELDAQGIALQVLPGAEVAASRALDLPDDELWALHLAGGPWLLLECPLAPAVTGFEAFARDLARRGHRILLAHPERSPLFHRDEELLARLVADGMLAQVTASAFTGAFGRRVEAVARQMLEAGLLANAATDAHSAAGARSPALGPTLTAAGLDDAVVAHLIRDAPAAIAAGGGVPAPPPVAPPRAGLLRRLRRA